MIGLSPDPATVRSMALTWGVEPMQVDTYASTDEMVWFAVEKAVEQGLIERGQTVLVLAGAFGVQDDTSSQSIATDVLRIVDVG